MVHTISSPNGFGVSLDRGVSVTSAGGGYPVTGGANLINSTLYGSYASGVILTLNPETIAASAIIASTDDGVTGVYGDASESWVLVNDGQINEPSLNNGEGNNLAYGVSFAGSGTITNAASALIYGYTDGVIVTGAGASLLNLGIIQSATIAQGGYGILLVNGGVVTNGQPTALVSPAYVHGYHGGIIFRSPNVSTLMNYGSISGLSGNPGVVMGAGTVINGASTSTGALIVGGADGVDIAGAGSVTNFGTIQGQTFTGEPTTYYGVRLTGPGDVSNLGSLAVIVGYVGVYVAAGATVTNGGTIAASTPTSTALLFGEGANRLIVEPGAVFVGAVNGGDTIGAASISTLELAPGGAGTLSGIGTQFFNFALTTIDPGANWKLSGTNQVVAGATVSNAGSLIIGGTLNNSGTLTGHRFTLAGASLTNQTAGMVSASYVYGAAAGAADTVVNQGTFTNNVGFAIYLGRTGTVSNAAGGVISGYGAAVKLKGTGATLTNLGQITATSPLPGGYGVYMRDGGLLTNGQSGDETSTALVEGYAGLAFKVVDVGNARGTLRNFGSVIGVGTAASGVLLTNVGTVFNGQDGATIALIEGGSYGVSGATAAITNYASIIATNTTTGYGIVASSGTIDNLGTAALIEGFGGVSIAANGTVINAGTIKSNTSAGTAVVFGSGTNRLVVDPGAVFYGAVNGGAVANTVMELATGGSANALYGFGSRIANFTTVVFDGGAQWTIGGDDSPGGLGTLEISGFTAGDTIALNGFVAETGTFNNGVLVLTNGGGDHATLHVEGAFTSGDFQFNGDDIIVCFAAGTHIATPNGERRIEALSPGDMVRTHFGGPAVIQWIGRRHVDCTRHPDPSLAWPVRVAAGAMGAGCPHRDLLLSPNHAVWVNNDLIPIRCLINDTSIARVPVDDVTYYHIELAQHDLLWAEGLRAESYLDVGDRANFMNGGKAMRLFPDFATPLDNAMLWELKGCAPLVVHGSRLVAARAWVDRMAEPEPPATEAATSPFRHDGTVTGASPIPGTPVSFATTETRCADVDRRRSAHCGK